MRLFFNRTSWREIIVRKLKALFPFCHLMIGWVTNGKALLAYNGPDRIKDKNGLNSPHLHHLAVCLLYALEQPWFQETNSQTLHWCLQHVCFTYTWLFSLSTTCVGTTVQEFSGVLKLQSTYFPFLDKKEPVVRSRGDIAYGYMIILILFIRWKLHACRTLRVYYTYWQCLLYRRLVFIS